ncbi:hypothetical protein HY496_02095 [Candidatus Woesearchaeota archaeon]|nr:hypothetical protein [Candidatus Woesearchaeota archaeon]
MTDLFARATQAHAMELKQQQIRQDQHRVQQERQAYRIRVKREKDLLRLCKQVLGLQSKDLVIHYLSGYGDAAHLLLDYAKYPKVQISRPYISNPSNTPSVSNASDITLSVRYHNKSNADGMYELYQFCRMTDNISVQNQYNPFLVGLHACHKCGDHGHDGPYRFYQSQTKNCQHTGAWEAIHTLADYCSFFEIGWRKIKKQIFNTGTSKNSSSIFW